MAGPLGTLDYVIFVLMFVFSAAAGFYAAFLDQRRKTNTMENFHRAGRQADSVSVALSLSVTIYSGLTIIGIPTEVYTYGTMAVWMLLGMLFATVNTAHVFLPVFYKLDKISNFEYLNLRFGPLPRTTAMVVYFICYHAIYGFILYAPCLAFQAMTEFSVYSIMAVAAAVSVLYTLLGGMKAVIWADTIQYIVILAGLVAILVVTAKEVGGFEHAWEIAKSYERLEFFNVSPDPRTRHTIWSLGIGFGLIWTFAYGINQASIQRASSLPTLRKAKLSVWLNYVFLFVIFALLILIGIVMFAYYSSCDPVKDGRIVKKDQLLSLVIVDLLTEFPGLPGLLLAVMFSGSLSTVSSGLSAFSAIAVEEIINRISRKKLSDTAQLHCSRICVVVIGCMLYVVAFGLSKLDGLLHQALISIGGVMAGPMLGLYISGMIFPWTNSKGAFCGFVTSFAMVLWVFIGALTSLKPPTPLPVSIDGCAAINGTTMVPMNSTVLSTAAFMPGATSQATMISAEEEPLVYNFYRMSYTWYTGFAMLVHLVVSLSVSFLTGYTKPGTIDPKLMTPFFYTITPFVPEKYRKLFLFGVKYHEKEKEKRDLDDEQYAKPVSEESIYSINTRL